MLLPAAARAADQDTSRTLHRVQDLETLRVLREVQERVEKLRGISHGGDIPAFYLDSETLREIVIRETEKQYPPERRKGIEGLLKSLGLIPEDFDLLRMLLPLLDEQVGGLYDLDTRRLYVREGFDIARSELARLILAHEICHALQDHAYDLASLGIEATDNDDAALAGLTVAEGDATLLTNEYAAQYVGKDILKELPGVLFMDQGALLNTPQFFQQQLLFPYLQGEFLMQEALGRNPQWRERIFLEPPQTTEQVIHPELYFDARDYPSSLSLLMADGQTSRSGNILAPDPPEGFRRLDLNRMGELGTRLIFQERLGPGIAHSAAAGWDGDAYLVCEGDGGKWWFAWESAWDSAADAEEYAGALVALWRALARDKDIGSLTSSTQEFAAPPWTVRLQRTENRVVATWWN